MSKPKVYLGGGLNGSTFEEADGWRKYSITLLKTFDIIGVSPLRGYKAEPDEVFTNSGMDKDIFSTERGLTIRDRWDVMNSDALLMNFRDAKLISIGSVMEIAWADGAGIPIIAVMEEGNIHEHAMLNSTISYRVGNLNEALIALKKMFTYE